MKHATPKYKRIGTINYAKDIKIMEYSNGDTRYFQAKICGWSNFKFTSKILLPMQLLEKTLSTCINLRSDLLKNPESIEKMATVYEIN